MFFSFQMNSLKRYFIVSVLINVIITLMNKSMLIKEIGKIWQLAAQSITCQFYLKIYFIIYFP